MAAVTICSDFGAQENKVCLLYSSIKLKVFFKNINIQKSVGFLYTSNEPSKKEIKKILCIIASKRIKYLRINFIKAVKDLYTEKYKIGCSLISVNRKEKNKV